MKEVEPKAPAFMMYARDWLASMSIATMSLAAEATYVRLLCHQWLAMRLPSDCHRVRMATRIGEAEWAAVWAELEPHFPEVEGGGRANPRLEAYRAEMLAKKGVRAEAGKKGAAAKWQRDEQRDGKGDGKRMANAKQNDGLAVAVAVAGKEPPISPTDDPKFVSAWGRYPKRAGSNSRVTAAKAFAARVAEGVDPAALIAATERYAAYCSACDLVGTDKVMQGQRFYGPNEECWVQAYDIPATAPGYVSDAEMRALGLDPAHEAEEAAFWEARRKAAGVA